MQWTDQVARRINRTLDNVKQFIDWRKFHVGRLFSALTGRDDDDFRQYGVRYLIGTYKMKKIN